ncbi:MAG: hypothetical protein U1F76_32715 [Candidatus Competibacteraceae bacterium]
MKPLLPKRRGKAVLLPDIALTGGLYGLVPVALTYPQDEKDPGLLVSHTLTGLQTFFQNRACASTSR